MAGMRILRSIELPLIVLWAFGYPLGALGVAAMSPMLLLFLRFGLSGAAMALLVAVTGRRLPRGADLGHAAIAGMCSQAVQFIGLYLGLRAGVPPAVAALVIAMNPVVTTFAARVTLGERLTRRKIAAATLAAVAVLCACWSAVGHLTHANAGIGFTLLGLAGLVVGGLYQQRFCAGRDPIALNAVALCVSAVPAGALALAFGSTVTDPVRGAEVVGLMVVLSSLVATTLYVRLIARSGAAGAATIFAVIPSVTALFSLIMFGTHPTVGAGIGLAVGAVACLIAAGRRGRGPAPTPAAAPVRFAA